MIDPEREDDTLTKEYCQHCGADIPEGAQSCPACGAMVAYAANDTNAPGVTAPEATPSAAPQPQYAPYPGAQASGVWAPPTPQPSSYPAYNAYRPYYQPAPTYPTYPAMQGQPYPPYAYPIHYPQYPQYYAPPRPQRAPGEVYALVIAWIVTIASGIALLGGLLVTALGSLGVIDGQANDLSYFGGIIGFALGPIIGGAFGLWYGITGIRRRRSASFDLPDAWMLFILALVALGGGLAVWQFNVSTGRAPGTAIGVLPLATLTGMLPALAILAFATQRLHNPSTRRHVWMSLFYGMTLAAVFAVVLELFLTVFIAVALHLTPQEVQSVLGQPNLSNVTPNVTLALFLVLSVVAPLVEEGVKPLGALLAIRRLRTPAEAFLVGLAAGAGFDILETIGYIGQGQADWISVAIERVGAGLLHGVGAGMGALGWYYLINGSGVPLRWLKGIGCGVYAVVQHGLFNAISLSGQSLPQNVSDWLNQPFFIGSLPLQHNDIIYLGIYLLLIGMLVLMTSRLSKAKGMPERKPPTPIAPYGPYSPYYPYPMYGQIAPANWPAPPIAPAATPGAQQPVGGAQ
ncbi:MAG TPA: PrsW family glutamic-type intramembrane protease [Ktedonobacterales bacterium]